MSFERLLKPRSIAAIGGAQAKEVIRQCDRMGFSGELWPVHPKADEVMGHRTYRSVEDLPDSPDAAYVGVNRHLTVEIVGALEARGAGGAICYATGFTEAGDEGSDLEAKLLAASGEMPLIGPNCYGMLNYVDGAMLWPDQQGGRRVDQGVAIITMSSNVAFNLVMQRRGLPIAYVMTLGNQLKFDLYDAIRSFAQEERVTAIGLFLEAISDPRAFEDAVLTAADLGKPVVAIKVGRSETAKRVVLSHTASLSGTDHLIDALFARGGVARVDSLEAWVEALKVLHVLGPLPGSRIGAMSTSGGDLSLLADAMDKTSLELPELSEAAAERLRSTLHERVVVTNPLDYQMFDWNDENRLSRTFSSFMADGFDLTLCLLDYPRQDRCDASSWDGAERGFARAVKETGGKGAILSTFTDTMPESLADRVIGAGIVPLAGIPTGLAGIQAAVDVGAMWGQDASPTLLPFTAPATGESVQILDEAEAKAVLAAHGIAVPVSSVVRGPEEAASAAGAMGLPVVAKALGIAHKSEAGGVRLSLRDEDAVAAAVREMRGLSDRFLIEQMVEDAVAELIIGVARDDQFGPYLLVGTGGVNVELMKDSRPLLLPVSRRLVRQTLEGLKGAAVFHGYRGTPRADLDAATEAILAVAELIESDSASINELDINPLLLLPEGRGVVAADALMTRSTKDE